MIYILSITISVNSRKDIKYLIKCFILIETLILTLALRSSTSIRLEKKKRLSVLKLIYLFYLILYSSPSFFTFHLCFGQDPVLWRQQSLHLKRDAETTNMQSGYTVWERWCVEWWPGRLIGFDSSSMTWFDYGIEVKLIGGFFAFDQSIISYIHDHVYNQIML